MRNSRSLFDAIASLYLRTFGNKPGVFTTRSQANQHVQMVSTVGVFRFLFLATETSPFHYSGCQKNVTVSVMFFKKIDINTSDVNSIKWHHVIFSRELQYF